MKKIHVIGNSHVSIFSGKSEIIPSYPYSHVYKHSEQIQFHSYHIGPTIAYNFFEHHYPLVSNILEKHVNKKNDYIMMIVGEVDCRWHLPKQAELQKKDTEILVKECISRFFRCFEDAKQKGYKCIGWGSHPSTNQGHNDDPSCPVYKNVEVRNLISKQFEEQLKNKCEYNSIPFLSILNDLINEDGTTKMEYFLDYCHLKANKVLPSVTEKLELLIKDL